MFLCQTMHHEPTNYTRVRQGGIICCVTSSDNSQSYHTDMACLYDYMQHQNKQSPTRKHQGCLSGKMFKRSVDNIL